MHGELTATRAAPPTITGSSPRAWGTLEMPHPSRMANRFIPTCMGNSGSTVTTRSVYSVHPHVHGELIIHLSKNNIPFGSSPRAWGTRSFPPITRQRKRFIPTCMGNSASRKHLTAFAPVHPHVHGELCCCEYIGRCWYGSSPRAWGTHSQPVYRKQSARFIPTCMGNSDRRRCSSSSGSVHPHVHGELSRIFIWNMEDYFLDTLMEGVSDR